MLLLLLFAELTAWLVAFVTLRVVNCLLLDVTYNDALNLRIGLSVLA